MDTNELEMSLKEWGDEEETSKPPSFEEMVAIPEASSEQSMKKWVGCKAFRNEGMSPEPSSISPVNDSFVIANLNAIGISLGDDDASISVFMDNLKREGFG
jgi:hypothetical protein